MKAGKFDFKKNIEIIEIRLFDMEHQEKMLSVIYDFAREENNYLINIYKNKNIENHLAVQFFQKRSEQEMSEKAKILIPCLKEFGMVHYSSFETIK